MTINAVTGANSDTKNYKESIQKSSDATFETRLKKAMDMKDEKALKAVCNDFEGIFTKIIFKQMKASVIKSDLVPKSNAKEIFESMLDEKLAEESSKAGGIGLGEMLYKQLKKDMVNKYRVL